jgi:hypothetical protein
MPIAMKHLDNMMNEREKLRSIRWQLFIARSRSIAPEDKINIEWQSYRSQWSAMAVAQ